MASSLELYKCKSLDNLKVCSRRNISGKCSRLSLSSSCWLPVPSLLQDLDIGDRYSPASHVSDLAARTLSVPTELPQEDSSQGLEQSNNLIIFNNSADLRRDKDQMCSDHLELSVKYLDERNCYFWIVAKKIVDLE